jgi:hypothetical protein
LTGTSVFKKVLHELANQLIAESGGFEPGAKPCADRDFVIGANAAYACNSYLMRVVRLRTDA